MTLRRNSFRRTAYTLVFPVLACGALLNSSARAEGLPVFPAAVTVTPATINEETAAALAALPAAPGGMVTPVTVTAGTGAAKPVDVKPAILPLKPVVVPATTVPVTSETLQAAARRLKLPLPLPGGHIVVEKAARRLELWSGSTLVKSYRVALGRTPSGQKAQQGDGRTPEGEFFICTRNAESSGFHIFLGLSYPALPDAKRGLQSKAISEREFQAIRNRLASRSVPLWRTRLGGWVGIHGGTGEAFARKQSATRHSTDWTAGCIALTNREIEEIYAATRMGTPVSVRA